MKILSSAVAIALLAIPVTGWAMGRRAPSAETTLTLADGRPAGRASFVERSDGVWMTIDATDLPPGVHGIHLHTTGACDAPEFKTAGGHWNPGQRMHGREAPGGAHLGDLPNLNVDAAGKGRLEILVAGAHVAKGEPALLDGDGTAVVVHAGPDDNMTDPAGNSGARIACGVVRAR